MRLSQKCPNLDINRVEIFLQDPRCSPSTIHPPHPHMSMWYVAPSMMKGILTLVLTVTTLSQAEAYGPPSISTSRTTHKLKPSPTFSTEDTTDVHQLAYPRGKQLQSTRREAMTAALVALTTFASSARADVIGAGRCANGEGDGCDSLAEGNAFIQRLQKKSLENKEENQRVSIYCNCSCKCESLSLILYPWVCHLSFYRRHCTHIT